MTAINQGQIPGRLNLNQTIPKCIVSSGVLKCFIAFCIVGQVLTDEIVLSTPTSHLSPNSSDKDVHALTHKPEDIVSNHKNELSSSASSNLVSLSVPLVSSSSVNSQGELIGFGDKFPADSWGFQHKLGHFEDNYDHSSHHEASSHMFSSTEDLHPQEVSEDHNLHPDHFTGNSSLSTSSEGAGADKRRGILTKTADGRPFIPIFTKHTKIYPTQPSSGHGHHHGWKSGGRGRGKRFKRRPKRKCRRCRRGHRRPRRRPRGSWGPPKGFRSHSPPHFEEDRKPASSSIFKNPFSFLARKRKRPRGPGPHRRNKPRGYPDTHEDYGDYGDEDDKPFVIKNKLNLNLNLVRGEGEEGDEDGGDDEGHPDDHEEHGNHGSHPPKEFGPFKGNPIVIGGNGHGHKPSSHNDVHSHHVQSNPSSHPKKTGKSKDPFWNLQIPNFDFGSPFKSGFGGNKDDNSREHFESNRGKSRFPTSISDIMDSDREKNSHHGRPPPHHGGPPSAPRGPPHPPHHHEDGPPPGFFDGPDHYDDGPPPHHHPYDGPFDGPPDGPPPPPPHPDGPPPPHHHEPEFHHQEPRPLHPGKKRPSHFEYSTGNKPPTPGMHHYKRPSGGKPPHHEHKRPPSHAPMSYSEEERFYENEGPHRRPPHSKRKPSWLSGHNHGKRPPPPHHDDGPDHASPDHIRNAPNPDDYYHPRRPLADGPHKPKQLGYYGFSKKPPSHHGPPNFHAPPEFHGPPSHPHGPPEHHNGPPDYHHGPPDYTEHHHGGPPDHHDPPSFHSSPPNHQEEHSNFHGGPPSTHISHVEHEEDEPVFLPPYTENNNNHDSRPPHTSHELHLFHTPPQHSSNAGHPPRGPPPTASKLRSPHSSPHPYMESFPNTHDEPPSFYEHSEIIDGSPQPHLQFEDNHRPKLLQHGGFNGEGPSREPPHFHSTGKPPRPQRPPRPPPSQLPHFDQVIHHDNGHHEHSGFDDHQPHHAPRVIPSSHAPPSFPPPPPTHYSIPPSPPRSPKPQTFFSSPHFVPNGPPSHFEHSPILMPSASPHPGRPHFLQPRPVSYSNFVHEHPGDRPHHHQKPPRPLKRKRPKNRHRPHIQNQHYPNSIQGIINEVPLPHHPSPNPPRRPLLEGPKPTAQYHPPAPPPLGSPENPEIVYGKPMSHHHGGDSLAYKPKGAFLSSSVPFKPFPTFSQAQKYALEHSTANNFHSLPSGPQHQSYRSHYSKPSKPQPIKYGSYEHPHGASLQESLTPTALYGSMKKVVSKLNPFGYSGNHSSSTSQTQQKPSVTSSGGYNKFGKYGKKIQQGKKNPYKLLSNTLYHQPMAGLVVKPMKPRPASYADSLIHNANSNENTNNNPSSKTPQNLPSKNSSSKKHVEFKGKAPKYSTLPEQWEHFEADPTHSTLPKLTYDNNGNQNQAGSPIPQHPNPKTIAKGQLRLKKRNNFDGRTMTKFTAADAVAKPKNLQKRNGEEASDKDEYEYEDDVSGSSISNETGNDEMKPAPAM